MVIVDAHEALRFADKRKTAWLQVAWGRSDRLSALLGPPVIDHYLPGLGPLSGWGIVDDASGITGCLLTGFFPCPNNVTIHLAGRLVDGDKLSIDPLDTLAQLPAGLLDELFVTSFRVGPGPELLDRQKPVVATSSPRALEICARLVAHLVPGGAPTLATAESREHNAPVVTVESGWISGLMELYVKAPPVKPGWLRIADWEDDVKFPATSF